VPQAMRQYRHGGLIGGERNQLRVSEERLAPVLSALLWLDAMLQTHGCLYWYQRCCTTIVRATGSHSACIDKGLG
jgi:hypothetical protein